MDREQQLCGGAVLRQARPGDEAQIVACIRALAEYEKEPDAVQMTAGDLRQALFASSPSVFAHVIEKEQRIVTSSTSPPAPPGTAAATSPRTCPQAGTTRPNG